MCCIFTCFSWLVDLLQRCWTFTMTCLISAAVCCSLMTASVSGIALGYNYSLAEYIDLKETNVSVYLKRGVFDDEVADDMVWRRSGHLPVAGHIKEDNLITGSSDDESSTLRSGRRLDDSVFQSNDKNNFEDSLMRLTAKAPDFSSTEVNPKELPIGDIVDKYPSNSLEQLKAVKSALNMRRMEAAASRATTASTAKTTYQDVRVIPNFPFSRPDKPLRRMPFDVPSMSPTSTINSLRNAVPADDINSPLKWMLPHLPIDSYARAKYMRDDYDGLTFPTPITPRPGPVRPTRPRYMQKTVHPPEPTRSTLSPRPDIPKSIDEEMDTFKEKFMFAKGDFSRSENDVKQKLKPNQKDNDDDYEDDIRGVPMRKKRNIMKLQEQYREANGKDDENKIPKAEKESNTEKSIKLNENSLFSTFLSISDKKVNMGKL